MAGENSPPKNIKLKPKTKTRVKITRTTKILTVCTNSLFLLSIMKTPLKNPMKATFF